MPIISAPHEFFDPEVYIDLRPVLDRTLYLKCEGFNFGGSVKLRPAAAMVDAAERNGLLKPDSILVESSSGNFGVAMSVIAASKGLRFTCVTDARCNPVTVRLMRALGADVLVTDEPDLRARLDLVGELCAADPRYVWLNQYTSDANWIAHYETTALGIAKQFPDLDVLFCAAGTAGTVTGCGRYFADNGRTVRLVAVDAVGSVIFGRPPAPRLLPGLGASVPPPLLQPDLVDDVMHVTEVDTIRTCRALAARGLLLGASTGTVVSGAARWLDREDPDRRLTAVAIAPDLGERYLDTVYDDAWTLRHFGPAALVPAAIEGLR